MFHSSNRLGELTTRLPGGCIISDSMKMGVRRYVLGFCAAGLLLAAPQASLRSVSGRPDMVTGGTALIEARVPGGEPRIALNGRDVTAAFRSGAEPGVLLGLVSGLRDGRNTLELSLKDKPPLAQACDDSLLRLQTALAGERSKATR